MKRIPMILLLMAPGATLAICYLADLDLTPGLFVCGALLILNMVSAFLLPRLGFKVKQILFWNLLLKLSQVPLISLILLFTLVMAMVGGEGIGAVAMGALLVCWLLMLSSSVFGISGFLWCHKYGTLSKAGMIASMIAQLIPCVDVIGSILCYIMFWKESELQGSESRGENVWYTMVETVPCYRLRCDMTGDSVIAAYNIQR